MVNRRPAVTKAVVRLHDLMLREAAAAVYDGSLHAGDMSSRFPQLSRRTVTRLSASLPPGLVDNDSRLTLTRALNRVPPKSAIIRHQTS